MKRKQKISKPSRGKVAAEKRISSKPTATSKKSFKRVKDQEERPSTKMSMLLMLPFYPLSEILDYFKIEEIVMRQAVICSKHTHNVEKYFNAKNKVEVAFKTGQNLVALQSSFLGKFGNVRKLSLSLINNDGVFPHLISSKIPIFENVRKLKLKINEISEMQNDLLKEFTKFIDEFTSLKSLKIHTKSIPKSLLFMLANKFLVQGSFNLNEMFHNYFVYYPIIPKQQAKGNRKRKHMLKSLVIRTDEILMKEAIFLYNSFMLSNTELKKFSIKSSHSHNEMVGQQLLPLTHDKNPNLAKFCFNVNQCSSEDISRFKGDFAAFGKLKSIELDTSLCRPNDLIGCFRSNTTWTKVVMKGTCKKHNLNVKDIIQILKILLEKPFIQKFIFQIDYICLALTPYNYHYQILPAEEKAMIIGLLKNIYHFKSHLTEFTFIAPCIEYLLDFNLSLSLAEHLVQGILEGKTNIRHINKLNIGKILFDSAIVDIDWKGKVVHEFIEIQIYYYGVYVLAAAKAKEDSIKRLFISKQRNPFNKHCAYFNCQDPDKPNISEIELISNIDMNILTGRKVYTPEEKQEFLKVLTYICGKPIPFQYYFMLYFLESNVNIKSVNIYPNDIVSTLWVPPTFNLLERIKSLREVTVAFKTSYNITLALGKFMKYSFPQVEKLTLTALGDDRIELNSREYNSNDYKDKQVKHLVIKGFKLANDYKKVLLKLIDSQNVETLWFDNIIMFTEPLDALLREINIHSLKVLKISKAKKFSKFEDYNRLLVMVYLTCTRATSLIELEIAADCSEICKIDNSMKTLYLTYLKGIDGIQKFNFILPFLNRFDVKNIHNVLIQKMSGTKPIQEFCFIQTDSITQKDYKKLSETIKSIDLSQRKGECFHAFELFYQKFDDEISRDWLKDESNVRIVTNSAKREQDINSIDITIKYKMNANDKKHFESCICTSIMLQGDNAGVSLERKLKHPTNYTKAMNMVEHISFSNIELRKGGFKFMKLLFSNCLNLQKIEFNHANGLFKSISSWSPAGFREVTDILKTQRSLHTLEIKDTFELKNEKLVDFLLKGILKSENITSLVITANDLLESQVLISIILTFGNNKYVHIRCESLSQIAKYLALITSCMINHKLLPSLIIEMSYGNKSFIIDPSKKEVSLKSLDDLNSVFEWILYKSSIVIENSSKDTVMNDLKSALDAVKTWDANLLDNFIAEYCSSVCNQLTIY